MGEHKHRPEAMVMRTTYGYRVIESHLGESVTLSIRRVFYDSDGKPMSYDHKPNRLEATTGDGLLALINDMAMALTKPSLLEHEFESLNA